MSGYPYGGPPPGAVDPNMLPPDTSAAQRIAIVQGMACAAKQRNGCLVTSPRPWTQIIYLLLLVIMGSVVLGLMWNQLKNAYGIGWTIVVIVVIVLTLVVAIVGMFTHCLVPNVPRT